ncbi:MAG TPA: hypothetical protein DET40_15270 [Lentisphaeria bacterium]|nr:MAG: hypothetical protein A2X45_05240 [Lentisphaerae bacterium GWF2_50_93]HCE44900.1 hypothetical protein [Lentisphaeria bacterium]
MATNGIGEKIYYDDGKSKVTNTRVTCEHITVPIGRIKSVGLNFRCVEFAFSIFAFFASLSTFAFLSFIPEIFWLPAGAISIFPVLASAFWVFMVYRNYVRLFISVNGRKIQILSVSMREKDYLSQIASAARDAMSDEERFQIMKVSGKIYSSMPVQNMSETMRIKIMLDDYLKLKEMKKIITRPETEPEAGIPAGPGIGLFSRNHACAGKS